MVTLSDKLDIRSDLIETISADIESDENLLRETKENAKNHACFSLKTEIDRRRYIEYLEYAISYKKAVIRAIFDNNIWHDCEE